MARQTFRWIDHVPSRRAWAREAEWHTQMAPDPIRGHPFRTPPLGSWYKMVLKLDSGKIFGLEMHLWNVNTRPCITSLGGKTLRWAMFSVRCRLTFHLGGHLWEITGLKLVGGLLEVQLNSRSDTFVWNRSKTFSMRAVYNDLITREGDPYDVSSYTMI
jgi:hypothetical protein